MSVFFSLFRFFRFFFPNFFSPDLRFFFLSSFRLEQVPQPILGRGIQYSNPCGGLIIGRHSLIMSGEAQLFMDGMVGCHPPCRGWGDPHLPPAGDNIRESELAAYPSSLIWMVHGGGLEIHGLITWHPRPYVSSIYKVLQNTPIYALDKGPVGRNVVR